MQYANSLSESENAIVCPGDVHVCLINDGSTCTLNACQEQQPLLWLSGVQTAVIWSRREQKQAEALTLRGPLSVGVVSARPASLRFVTSRAARAMRATPAMQPMTMPAMAPPLRPESEEEESAAWVLELPKLRLPAPEGEATAEGRTVAAMPWEMEDGEVTVMNSSTEMEPVTSSSTWGATCRQAWCKVRAESDSQRIVSLLLAALPCILHSVRTCMV